MNSDYNHNPLTEVALALSMAFFAHGSVNICFNPKEQEKSSIKSLVINNSSQVKIEKKLSQKSCFILIICSTIKIFRYWI